ncbi:hypothetical protein FOZ63_021172, partial [Perkinsus olseni]
IKPESVQSLVDSCSTAADSLLRSLEESRNVSPRPCTSSSTIRPEVLRFLSDIFDKGNDDDLASEVDSGVNLGFEGGLRRSGVFPAAKATKKPDGDADFFQEYSAGRLRPGNYFSAPDAVSAIKSVVDEELRLGRVRELHSDEARQCGRFFSRLAAVPKGKLAPDGVSQLYRLVEDFKRSGANARIVPVERTTHPTLNDICLLL